MCSLSISLAQSQLPDLAQIKAAAERGDAAAQDRLGDAYYAHLDGQNALVWYRKAAEQGIANSQYQLGHLLSSGNPPAHAPPDEAIRWYAKAANQNHKQAQFELGRAYQDGKLVHPDYVEAYKWFSLAKKQSAPIDGLAKFYLDHLILKMTQEQIAEGQKKVDAFLAGGGRELPEPSFVSELKLTGISGKGDHLLAIINGRTFEVGEEGTVRTKAQKVKIKCLSITTNTVSLKADGVERIIELKMK